MKWVLSKVEKSAAKDGWADWIVLDGGPLQIKAGEQGLHKENFTPPLFALAKSRQGYSASVAKERIYKSGIEEPVFLIPDSPERLFLEHVRNEAHRFAVSYHRKKRDKVQLQLEKIPGIGRQGPRTFAMVPRGFKQDKDESDGNFGRNPWCDFQACR
jgi:excinuclease ABC subunit C